MSKSSREMSFEATKMVLEKAGRPMKIFDIWQEIKANNFFGFDENLGFSGATPSQSFFAAINENTKEESSIFEVISIKPKMIKLKNQNLIENNEIIVSTSVSSKQEKSVYHERDLHAVLSFFVANSVEFDEVYTKTIYHEKSVKSTKGADKWLHPDIVGVKFNYKFYRPELMNFNKKFDNLPVVIYSFEMKKELTMGNLKEYYFQAVSNSSWANEGYLVALNISKDDDLRSAILRLNSSFGIGVISLNSANPAQSEIIAPAKYRENIDMIVLIKI